MKTHFMGDSALLVETAGPAEAQALRRMLSREPMSGLWELIPGESSLLIAADPLRADLEALAARIPILSRDAAIPAVVRQHELAVRYTGEDLAFAAKLLGMDAEELVRRHVAPLYTVSFLGFAPGFAYLSGLDERLKLPRRSDPRIRVPDGSVAIADGYTGVYPQATPGGWHILGHCDAVLFDARCASPAALAPGDHVRFRALA